MNHRVKILAAASLIVFNFVLIVQTSAVDEPSLKSDKLLEKIAVYEFGQSRENLIKLEDIVRQSHDSPGLIKQLQAQFLEFLRSDATPAGKRFICRQLSIIGTEESVPTLAKMLTEPEIAEMARYALERIPGEATDQALCEALDKTTGKNRVGIINSLSDRHSKAAVTPLSKLLSSTDKETAHSAAAALGKIATPPAAAELGNALKQASGDMHADLADAYLTCAYNLAAAGDKKAAENIYKELYTTAKPVPIRSAALVGIVDVSPQDAAKLIIDAIKGNDSAMKPVAISLVRKMPADATHTIAAELPNLSPAGQVQLLAALAARKDASVLPLVVAAAKAPDQQVRLAALNTLASLGDASTVTLLAQTAAETNGAEQQAARECLYSLKSPGVNETIVELIADADSKVKVELIRSIGERNMTGAVQTLLKTANDSDGNVRLESIKVLKDIAEPSLLPTLVDILINAKTDMELREAEKTVASVSRKGAAEKAATAAILDVLDSVTDINARCALLSILGGLGDSRALGKLRESLEDDNAEIRTAAVRALGEWPNAEPAADLLKISQLYDGQTIDALALRGFVRLITLESDRPAEETMKMLRQAMRKANNNNERKMILAALAEVKSAESLQMAVEFMDNMALHQEAAAAVIKIAESTMKTEPEKTKAALEMAMTTTRNESLKKHAQELLDQIK